VFATSDLRVPEVPPVEGWSLWQPTLQLVGEVQQKRYMHIALHVFPIWTTENGEAFAVGVEVENSDEVRQQHRPLRPNPTAAGF
jgi:hypothetical protein